MNETDDAYKAGYNDALEAVAGLLDAKATDNLRIDVGMVQAAEHVRSMKKP